VSRDVFASVVMPTCNRPAMLARALGSVLAQDFPDWEAIVVDDGDGSGREFALGLGDPRVRTIPCPGRGQVDARSAAIDLARGRYVCWLDDDDWWEDGGHLSLLRATTAAGAPGFCFRGGWIVFERGGDAEREVFDLEATEQTLLKDNTVLTSSLAYPRDVHARIGPLDRSLAGYCDWDLMLRMCAAGLAPIKLPGLGVCYSVREDNVSREYDAPERLLAFRRFAAKHDLDVVISNHVRMHRALAAPAGSEASGRA
jgi:glycosyltransferase involved in cell wall biosynthesis